MCRPLPPARSRRCHPPSRPERCCGRHQRHLRQRRMQSQAAKDKKEKKEKKEKKARASSAGKAVSAVGKFFQAARGSRTNGEKPITDEVATNRRDSNISQFSGRQSLLSETSSLMYSASEANEGVRSGEVAKQARPSATPCGATTTVEPVSKQITQVVSLLNKQAVGRSSGKVSGQVLTAAHPVEDFLEQGLLSVPPEGLLQVNAEETIGSVVEKLYRWKLFSCIVSFGSDQKKEFFDCMDLASFMLEVIAGSGNVMENEDWATSKLKLQRVAEAQVQDALRAPRGTSEFKRFDAEGSFLDLLVLFASYKRVPIYRRGELCRVITAADILEMCNCVSEDTLACLEGTHLAEMMEHWPGMLSRIRVHEDFGMLEVIQTIRDGNVNAVPVVEGFRSRSGISEPDSAGGGLIRKPSMGSLSSGDDGIVRTLVGQFDIAALRVMLVHNANDAGVWWWEDENLTKNILFEPCMDFISLSSAVVVSQSVSAPFFMIQAEETLARTIARLLASTYHSVVVYPSGSQAESPRCDAGEVKSLDGLLSSIALVVAMMQAGLFDVLSWDSSKPRKDASEPHGVKRSRGKKTSLTKIVAESLVNQISDENDGGRVTKVKFCSVIELECLDVPTCPEHGFRHLKFTAVQDGEGKYAMDFRTLRDLNDGTKVGGAAAQCNACMKSLGRVTLRQRPREVLSPPTPATSSSGQLAETNGTWFDMFFARNSSSSTVSLRPRTPSKTPPAPSALKRGTAPLKKSKTAERLVAIRDKQLENSDSHNAKGGSFFGMCCSPCRMHAEKDQIQTSMRIVGGVECPPGEGRSPDSPYSPHRSSRQNSKHDSAPNSDRGSKAGRRRSKGDQASLV